MALVKNDLPILEYDDDLHGLVVPNRNENYHFPRRAVLFFGADAVAEFSKSHGASGLYAGAHVGHEQDAVCQEAGEFVNVTKAHKIYKVQWRGYAVCLSAAPVGAAAAVQLLDFLLACGCDAVIAGGSCGALEPLAEGAFLAAHTGLAGRGGQLPLSAAGPVGPSGRGGGAGPGGCLYGARRCQPALPYLEHRRLFPRDGGHGGASACRGLCGGGDGVCRLGCLRGLPGRAIWPAAVYGRFPGRPCPR